MRAVTHHDLIIGRSHFDGGGLQISQQLLGLPNNRLRATDDAVIDIKDHTAEFFIDDTGAKHIAQHKPEWQAVACAWDDELVEVYTEWRVPTDTDRLNVAKAYKRRQVNDLRNLMLSVAFDYAFPDAVPGSIDVRDQRDLANVQALVTNAQLLFEQGVIDPAISFRDAEDQTHLMTPPQVKEMGMVLAQHQAAIYAASWMHKDAIKAAVDQVALDALDITTRWPV